MRIITGCSRSGTSFVCQLLAELGADFGAEGDLVEADEWNRRGYFENRAVNTLNHRLLFGRGSDPHLWVDVMWPKGWRVRWRKLTTLALSPLLTRGQAIEKRAARLAGALGAASAANVGRCVKDPRFCYLMTPWARHGAVESALFVVRHPWEAASSMSRQTGLPLALTLRGWMDSVRRFWDEAPVVPTRVVDYNAFFDPEKRVDATRPLFDCLGIDFDVRRADAALEATLDPDLRTRDAPDVRLPAGVRRLYGKLLERCRR